MKQNITIDQLKELNSDEKVCSLNTLMNHEWDLSEEEFKEYNWNKILKDTSEYCTIGRMIEVIANNIPRIPYIEDSIDIEIDRVVNTCFVGYRIADCEFVEYDDVELCDALWKVVKELL